MGRAAGHCSTGIAALSRSQRRGSSWAECTTMSCKVRIACCTGCKACGAYCFIVLPLVISQYQQVLLTSTGPDPVAVCCSGRLALEQSRAGSAKYRECDARDREPCLHCAGIGRTGTFCAVDIALQRLCSRDYGVAVSAAELKPIVAELRRQRAGMVQTAEQYHFCYQVRSKPCTPQAWRNAGLRTL